MGRVAAVTPADCMLSTLGSFELRVRGAAVPNPATQKARALLTYLALHRQTDVPRDRLVDVFWPDAEPDRARDSLNTALHSIRRGLRTANLDPNDFLFANKSIVRWEADVDLDVDRLESALASDDGGAAAEALSQYHGEFLEGDYDDWASSQRELFAERYERLLSKTLRSTKAPDVAKKLLARNPYDEDAYATLIDAEMAAGRHFSAAQIVRQCYAALHEMGTKPSPAFEERYKHAGKEPSVRAATLDVPFVGRDEELDELVQIIAPERSGSPSVALIEGEPGIGKSALLQRVIQHAEARGARSVTIRGVLDDARAFGIWPSIYTAVTGNAFSTFLQGTQGDAASHLATTILENLHDPTVIAVDDAQYLSGDSLATLAALAKNVAALQTHVLVIAVRPEGLERLLQSLGDSPHTSIRLDALSDASVETALALAGIEMDAQTSEILRSRAGGHPLYLKGLLEQLVRSGTLRSDGKRWELAQPDAELQLPPSLRRLIEGRLRARGQDAVATACALALEATTTPIEIAQVTDLSQEAVLDALDDLLRYHIIVELPSGPRQFAFSHDLLEEAARNLLPAVRRKQLHATLARVLSASEARGRALRCAAHFEAAAMYAQALTAYSEAAQEAADLQAANDTLQRCDAGLRCLKHLADAPAATATASRLYQLRSFAYRLLWQLDPCFINAQQAVDLARQSGDLRCLADALRVLRSAINLTTMDVEEALQVSRELAVIGERLGEPSVVIKSLVDEGHTYRIAFEPERAEPCLRRAFHVAVEAALPKPTMEAALQLLSLQASWWRFEDAGAVIEALKKNQGHVDWPFRAHAALALALFWTEIERYDRAQTELQFVTSTLETSRIPSTSVPNAPRSEIAIRTDYFHAALHARRGTWNDGLSDFSPHRPRYEQVLNEQRYKALFSAAYIDLLLGRNDAGDADLALQMLSEAQTPWEPETGYQPGHAWIVIRARVHARARLPDARQLLEEACDFLDAELLRCPFGIDFAFRQVAEAAEEIELRQIAARAEDAGRRLRERKLAAATDLVSV